MRWMASRLRGAMITPLVLILALSIVCGYKPDVRYQPKGIGIKDSDGWGKYGLGMQMGMCMIMSIELIRYFI